MLAVVQHQQQLPAAQVSDDGVGERPRSRGDSQSSGDGGWKQGGVRQRRQVDEDDAIGERAGNVMGHGHGKPGLANPTRADQGEQGDGLFDEQFARRGNLRLSSYEGRARQWQGVPVVDWQRVGHRLLAVGLRTGR